MLFHGFAPGGQSTLFGPRPGPASASSTPLTAVILQDPPPVSPAPRAGVHRSGVARAHAGRSPCPAPRPAAPPRPDAGREGSAPPRTRASPAPAPSVSHVHNGI